MLLFPSPPSSPLPSDPNVLLSVWFSLLRLLDGTLDQVPHFPAGDLFVKVWMSWIPSA